MEEVCLSFFLRLCTAVYSKLESIATAFCQKYLQDYGDVPLSTIRYWLHEFSVIVKNTPRPALVWWREDTILLFGHNISFPLFKLQLRKKLLQLEQFILKTILFGMYSMDELEATFGISRVQDNGDEKSIGYGIIADTSTPGMDNSQSAVFFDAIFKHQHLGLQSDPDGRILFDKELALQWITNIDDAMRQFFPISHNTTISGRGTEAESLRPANNNIGRRNVIFDHEAGTGAYDADYHKGQERTGTHKHILRHMPYEVFRILYILVRIVRPIEFFFVCRAFVPFDARPRVHDAYSNHIFASFGAAWNTTTMTSSLEAFFQDVAGFPMGLRQNRHFSIALQRRYLDYGAAKPDLESTLLERTLNRLRGHEKEVGDANYAREGVYGSSSVNERQYSQFLSKLWHKALGFPTSYSEVMAREVVEVVTHRAVKNVTGALKKLKKMSKKTRSSPLPHPAPKAAIASLLRKKRVSSKIYLEVDSGSGEEFDFGDTSDASDSEGSNFEPRRMMETASEQSGKVENALQGQKIEMVSRAGQTGGIESRRSERVAKRLKKN